MHITKNEIKRRLRRFRRWKEETFDYYSVNTYFILKKLQEEHSKNIASVGCRLNHLIPMQALYENIIHFSMLPIKGLGEFNSMFGGRLVEVCGDFFSLEDGGYPEVDAVISQAAIHCMTDTRYGNKQNQGRGGVKPYQFAAKCRKVFPNAKVVVVSVTINKDDFVRPNGAWLSEDKLIRSFESAGFYLCDRYYDKFGYPKSNEARLTKSFPEDYSKKVDYIMGNYCFKSKQNAKTGGKKA